MSTSGLAPRNLVVSLIRGLAFYLSGVALGLSSPGSRCPVVVTQGQDRYLVDSASSHMLVSKIKPCMSKYKQLYGETANGSRLGLLSVREQDVYLATMPNCEKRLAELGVTRILGRLTPGGSTTRCQREIVEMIFHNIVSAAA